MATIKYLLKKSKINKEGKAPLYIAIYHEDQTELIFTKEYIKPALWDQDNQRVRALKNLPEDVTHIDVVIGKLKQQVVKVHNDLKSDLEVDPTAYQIKEAWTKKRDAKKSEHAEKEGKQKQDEKSIHKKIDSWTSNVTYAPLTVKAVINSLKKFKEYLSLVNVTEVKGVTKDVANAYAKWLFEKKKYAKSSHGRHVKHLRWFIKSLTPPPFDFRDLKIHNSKKKVISLSWDELQKLEAFDVSGLVEQQKSKDMFLLGCYTGLRISDLRRINKSFIHIDIRTGEREIRLTTLKNKRDVEIPILPECWKILTRYDLKAPRISEQTVNAEIKKICDSAGINEVINMTSTNGNKVKDVPTKKNDAITIHVGGKTFLSLAEERFGLSISQAAAIAGKDPRTVATYYKSLDTKAAKEKMRASIIEKVVA